MSIAAQPSLSANDRSAGVPNDFIWRLSVDQYHEMIRSGILTDDDPVELLEGWPVFKLGKNPPPVLATRLTREAPERLLPSGWFIALQDPITTDTSEPEPDAAVVRGNPRLYFARHPSPEEVALVVEIAEATLRRDVELKSRIYAASGIPVYWIVNLPEKQLEVYTNPSGPTEQPAYRQRQVYGVGDEVLVVIDGHDVGQVPVKDLLP